MLTDRAADWLQYRFRAVARLTEGTPLILVEHGRPLQERLRRENISIEDVLAAARQHQDCSTSATSNTRCWNEPAASASSPPTGLTPERTTGHRHPPRAGTEPQPRTGAHRRRPLHRLRPLLSSTVRDGAPPSAGQDRAHRVRRNRQQTWQENFLHHAEALDEGTGATNPGRRRTEQTREPARRQHPSRLSREQRPEPVATPSSTPPAAPPPNSGRTTSSTIHSGRTRRPCTPEGPSRYSTAPGTRGPRPLAPLDELQPLLRTSTGRARHLIPEAPPPESFRNPQTRYVPQSNRNNPNM